MAHFVIDKHIVYVAFQHQPSWGSEPGLCDQRLNQYTSVGGSGFTYDARGDLTSDGVRSFTYDVMLPEAQHTLPHYIPSMAATRAGQNPPHHEPPAPPSL